MTAPTYRSVCQHTGDHQPRMTKRLDEAAKGTLWRSAAGMIWAYEPFNSRADASWHFWSTCEGMWLEGGVLAQTGAFDYGGPFTEHFGPRPDEPETQTLKVHFVLEAVMCDHCDTYFGVPKWLDGAPFHCPLGHRNDPRTFEGGS
jgi:hypothetical protein